LITPGSWQARDWRFFTIWLKAAPNLRKKKSEGFDNGHLRTDLSTLRGNRGVI